jgi:DeoR family fructose operon transcriptional repressor
MAQQRTRESTVYAAERQQRIMAEARQAGRVEVTALADVLGVAAETIRRDLSALERRGSLRRVHGGAIPVERLEVEPTLATRFGRLADVKRRIAARALELVPAGGSIVLDSGTTTQALAELLPADTELTVVTNSVQIAGLLCARPGITFYLVGGRVRGVTGAAVGDWATAALRDLVVDVAFLGTNGLSVDRGLTTPDQDEAAVKRAMVRAGRTAAVLADSSKAGDDHLHRFAAIDEVDVIVTDTDLPDDVAADLRAAGPEVVIV